MFSPSTGWGWTFELTPAPVWHTTDGGRTWMDVSPPALPDNLSDSGNEDVYFLDGTHAWVAETGQSGPASSGAYIRSFRTSDGGRTWQEGAPITGLNPYGFLNPQLYFVDRDHGWLVVSTESASHLAVANLYRTSDGGLDWDLASTSQSKEPGACGPTLPTFATVTMGWLVSQLCGHGAPSLLVTHDGGTSWDTQVLPVTPPIDSYFDSPVFVDQMHGLLVLHGSRPLLLVTSDGGSTWNVRSFPWEVQLEVNFVDVDHGWAIGGSSDELGKFPASIPVPLYRTDDGGLTWVRVPTTLLLLTEEGRIESLYFVDRKKGFATRVDSLGASQFLTTTDGGLNWTVVATRPTS